MVGDRGRQGPHCMYANLIDRGGGLVFGITITFCQNSNVLGAPLYVRSQHHQTICIGLHAYIQIYKHTYVCMLSSGHYQSMTSPLRRFHSTHPTVDVQVNGPELKAHDLESTVQSASIATASATTSATASCTLYPKPCIPHL